MKTISRIELKKKIDQKDPMDVVEVLPEDRYKEGHLPVAKNIPVDEKFAENAKNRLPEKNREVVVYCSNTDCPASEKAAKDLENMGYKNVSDYKEGKQDWKQAGYPLEK